MVLRTRYTGEGGGGVGVDSVGSNLSITLFVLLSAGSQ